MKCPYQEKVMEHYRSSRNRAKLENPSFSSGNYNPTCGDAIVMQGMIKDGKLTEVQFEGKGCILSQGAASILADHVRGMTLDEVRALQEKDMPGLVGMELGPTRLKCVTIALQALQEGIKEAGEGNAQSDETVSKT